jgi:hypothetical protein
MRNVSDENCREKIRFNKCCFKNRAVYETMWKNVLQPDRPQMTTWSFACSINKATDTHSEHVVFITPP